MRTWLRANAVGLAAIVACLPVLAAVLIAVPLADDASRSDHPRAVRAGAAATEGGLTFRVRVVGAFARAQGLTTPPGSAVISAIVDVTPAKGGATASGCTVQLGAPGGGGRREWRISSAVTDYGYVPSDDLEHDCVVATRKPYRLEALFLAPAGTERTGSIDVTLTEGQQQRTLRLRLPTPVKVAPAS